MNRQGTIEDAGLAKILRRAKKQDAGSPGISLAEMKRRLGIPAQSPKRRTAGHA